MISFGPQLIGQTEKTLNAILAAVLAESGLSEPQWVTLRLTAQFKGTGSLPAFIRGRAHFADPESLVSSLAERGFVSGDRLTDAGKAFLHAAQGRIEELTAPIWEGLPADDVAATEQVLNTVLERGHAVVALLGGE